MNFEDIKTQLDADMRRVNDLILQHLSSDVVLINQIGNYIVSSGGKRLRPMITLVSAQACGYTGNQHYTLAAIIEFIHTATLLHDDVVDESDLRRNRDTANHIWGNAASVLVGDFLYSRAFEMMTALGQMRVMDILSHATNRIAEGEVLQLLNCNDPDTDEDRYMEVIKRKTATLFQAGSRLGAVISTADPTTEQALADYGEHLGIAFQLVDDLLDYSANREQIGKNIGDDLTEGKPTLPLIRCMQQTGPDQRELIRSAIEQGGKDQIDDIQAIIAATDATQYTAEAARRHAGLAKKSLDILAESPAKSILEAIADFSVARSY